MTVRRGMTMGHPCPNFAASMPATRGLIAAPWTPASLSLFRGKRSGLFRTARRLTQNRAQRFHLNPVPRHHEECHPARGRSEPAGSNSVQTPKCKRGSFVVLWISRVAVKDGLLEKRITQHQTGGYPIVIRMLIVSDWGRHPGSSRSTSSQVAPAVSPRRWAEEETVTRSPTQEKQDEFRSHHPGTTVYRNAGSSPQTVCILRGCSLPSWSNVLVRGSSGIVEPGFV